MVKVNQHQVKVQRVYFQSQKHRICLL